MKVNIPKIEAERERIGESKAAFAARIGLQQSNYIKLIKSASTRIQTISMIADALHIDPRDLLTR